MLHLYNRAYICVILVKSTALKKMFFLTFCCITFVFVNSEKLAIQMLIINGLDTDITNVPYQLMLTYTDKFYCGAVLISPKHILTAAHCLYDGSFRNKHKLNIFAGVTTKSRRHEEGQMYGVKKYVIHWLFFLTGRNGDIGIIFPSKIIEVDGITVKPIALAAQNYRAGHKALASGWGMLDDKGTMPDNLQATMVKTTRCHMFRDSICAKGDSGICKGDSGGPLVYENKLIGIARAKISTNGKCTSQREIYSSVHHYRKFIKRHTDL